MRTPRLRKLVADATALRRECAQERTLFYLIRPAAGRHTRTPHSLSPAPIPHWSGLFRADWDWAIRPISSITISSPYFRFSWNA